MAATITRSKMLCYCGPINGAVQEITQLQVQRHFDGLKYFHSTDHSDS